MIAAPALRRAHQQPPNPQAHVVFSSDFSFESKANEVAGKFHFPANAWSRMSTGHWCSFCERIDVHFLNRLGCAKRTLGGTMARREYVIESAAERRHTANILAWVDRDAHISQRKLANELGIALALVNLYLKRCAEKGLIKVRRVPSRRYAYFLTPRGFAEKSRLTAEYLSWSLTFFRRARAECTETMIAARRRKWQRVALVGASDIADIAILCASEQDLSVVGLVDAGAPKRHGAGVRIVADIIEISPAPDGWVVTAIDGAQTVYDAIVRKVGPQRVLVPAMLMVRPAKSETE